MSFLHHGVDASGGGGGDGSPGGGCEGEGDTLEHPLQVVHILHHHPGLLSLGPLGGPGALLLEDGHPPVLVDGELGQEVALPGQPDLVEKVGPGLGELDEMFWGEN